MSFSHAKVSEVCSLGAVHKAGGMLLASQSVTSCAPKIRWQCRWLPVKFGFTYPKGPKYLIWGKLIQAMVVIPTMDSPLSAIRVLRARWVFGVQSE